MTFKWIGLAATGGCLAICAALAFAGEPATTPASAHPAAAATTETKPRPLDQKVSFFEENVTLEQVLGVLVDREVSFVINHQVVDTSQRLAVSIRDVPLREVLDIVAKNCALTLEVSASGVVSFLPDPEAMKAQGQSRMMQAMRQRLAQQAQRRGRGGSRGNARFEDEDPHVREEMERREMEERERRMMEEHERREWDERGHERVHEPPPTEPEDRRPYHDERPY